jgi:hypothetical protein
MTRLVLAVLLALVATSADAALPAPPFELTLSSTALTEGEAVTVRVAAKPGSASDERHDVYLMLASVEEAAFLTPDGAWAPAPVPWARALSTREAPVVRPWPRAWPAGRYAFGLVVVPVAANPLTRSEWRYRPGITWFDVRPLPPPGRAPAPASLWLLGAATLAAVALVWWAGQGR